MSYPKPLSSMEEFDKHKNDSTIHVTPTKVSNWDAKVDSSDYVKSPGYGIAVQTATNVYAVTLSPAPTAYTDGMGVVVKIPTNSTAATSINVNTLGPKSILKPNGSAVTNLKANAVYHLRYNGSNFILLGEGGEYGTATASQVIAGYTIGTENGLVTGTMPIRGAVSANLNAGESYTIPDGYHNGSGIIRANSLVSQTAATAVAADIASGKTAWVNGVQVTGTAKIWTMTAGGTSSVAYLSYDSSPLTRGSTIWGSMGSAIVMRMKGSVRLSMRVSGGRASNGGEPASFRFFKNDVGIGEIYSVSISSNDPLTYTLDVACEPNDKFQVYARSYDGSYDARLHRFSAWIAEDLSYAYTAPS